MYRDSPLMSTPVANDSRSDEGPSGKLSPTCLFPSFTCDFLDGDSSFECCSIDPLTGSHYICRRSPRLLTNGYYIWTEDSFFCDPDGHITLNPSQTSVMYKENLVRIFRKKKRTHRSLSSLLDPEPLSLGCMEVSLEKLTHSQVRISGWMESGALEVI